MSNAHRLRHSMDTALDKVKDRTRRTIDKRAHTPEGESSSRRLSSFVPSSRKRREKRDSSRQNERTMSVQSGESSLPTEGNYELGSRSGSSLVGVGSGHSSLFTDEEPEENTTATTSAGYVSHHFTLSDLLFASDIRHSTEPKLEPFGTSRFRLKL